MIWIDHGKIYSDEQLKRTVDDYTSAIGMHVNVVLRHFRSKFYGDDI